MKKTGRINGGKRLLCKHVEKEREREKARERERGREAVREGEGGREGGRLVQEAH